MPNVVAVICARMTSERFPGKMMRKAAGVPLLGHLLKRIAFVKKLDDVVVATPKSRENNGIAEYCAAQGIACFRGPEDDVLTRMVQALESLNANVCVEVYGDGPLIDPRLIDSCLETYFEGSYDWVGNDIKPGYPSGMFTEAFSMDAFRDSASRTDDPAIREHGTLYLRQHPELYRQKILEANGPLKRPDIHLEIDTEEDFAMFETIINHFAPREDFSLEEILAFLDANPALAGSNRNVPRRWQQYQRT